MLLLPSQPSGSVWKLSSAQLLGRGDPAVPFALVSFARTALSARPSPPHLQSHLLSQSPCLNSAGSASVTQLQQLQQEWLFWWPSAPPACSMPKHDLQAFLCPGGGKSSRSEGRKPHGAALLLSEVGRKNEQVSLLFFMTTITRQSTCSRGTCCWKTRYRVAQEMMISCAASSLQ